MTGSSIFCPVCQRKNKIDATRCDYCGALLQMKAPGMGNTTLNITPSLEGMPVDYLCEEHLKQLDPGDICFVLEKKQLPIVIRKPEEVVIGRFFDESDPMNLDLDPYGGGAYGVSRRHARIIRVDDKFVIEDLNSTNGSWLNGQRIPSGTTYPLLSGDQVWFGQFKLQACFHQGETIARTSLFLRDTDAQAKKLTPINLVTAFGPFIKAISDLQELATECLHLLAKDVTIEKIDASGSDSYIIVEILNNPEALHLIRKWITPWRLEQQKDGDLLEAKNDKQAIVELTSRIIADITPDMSNEERFAMIEKALPIVTILAVNSIELSFEAL